MNTSEISQFLKDEKLLSNPIYADSAEPRLISELRKMGHNIFSSIKGRDSVNAGIDLLKRYKIKAGMLTNVPEDKHNHIIDPCRYATYSILSRPNFGKYTLH